MDMLYSDSDIEHYAESSDSDDQDDTESTYDGYAESLLSNLDDSIEKIDGYLAFERGFVHGDIVRSVCDPSGQMGRVVNVDITVDLESSCGQTIQNVNSKHLLRVRSFIEGDHVVYGPWLGKVDTVYDLVTVLMNDGANFVVSTRDTEILTPVSRSFPEDAPFVYYPGQHVKLNCSASFKYSRWLCGRWCGGQDEGIVCQVEVGSVLVNWIDSVTVAHGTVLPTPPSLLGADGLTLLSCFPHANWQLGDCCKLSQDYFQNPQIGKEQDLLSITAQWPIEMKKLGKADACEQTYVISKTKTILDVLWQDGKLSVGLELQNLVPVNAIGDHDFWPEQLVLEKATCDYTHISNRQQSGIVEYVNAQECIAKVKWIDLERERTDDCNKEFKDETVSVYELTEHPDYSYCLGDVVFRLCPLLENSKENLPSVQTCIEKQSFSYLSCIGSVISFKDGGIEVRWASGLISKVEPGEICGIEKFDAPTPPVLNEATEGAECDKLAHHKKEKDFFKKDAINCGEGCIKNLWDTSGALLFPRVAVGLFENIASSFFSFHGSKYVSGEIKYDSSDDMDSSCNADLGLPALGITDVVVERQKIPGEQISSMKDVPLGLDNSHIQGQTNLMSKIRPEMNKKLFKKFDIADDYSDHHFINGVSKEVVTSQVKRSWLKKIHQEWSILEKNLPDSIHVRVYEERMNLLRASIVGAAGTPYQDALFFFDICFPPDYPHVPPLVHYNSGGLRLNPNLYESGKVCLSLLKTWVGTGTEVWNPESSTILQVLLSIQALVLNEKPYFNEAGYDKQIGHFKGERNAITYNENAFLLSRKSMLYHLCKPPKQFEALVAEHFNSRAHHILCSCKAYIDDENVKPDEVQKHTSTGFKIMLAKLFPKLISVFTERGIECSRFLDPAGVASEMGKEFT